MSEALPPPQTAERRTEPVGLVLRAIAGLRQLVPALLALVFVLRDQGPWLLSVVPLAILAAGATGFWAWLQWRKFTYRVGEEDIRVESGVLSRAARSVPYERIQDVSLEQGLLARIFGLVTVRFETGAGGKDELALAYLKEAEGERLRELVRARRDGMDARDMAEPVAPEPAPEMLFALPPRRLFTFGLFEFSLAVVAVAAGVVQQFDVLLPFDPWDFDGWQERLAGPGAWLAHLGPVAQVVGGLIAVGSLIALGVATGLVRTTLRDWGFVLERTEKGFRRRRGLLTRTDVVMPAHRVQALKFSTGIVRRLFGWHGLKFVSLAQDAGAESHDVAPFARWAELAPIARAAGFAAPDEALDWHRASARYRTDTALIAGGMVAAIALAALLALSATQAASPLFALIPLALALPIAAWQWFLWRFERHALDGQQLYARHGWLAPRTDVANRVKLHSAEIVQGPIARRRGYASLRLGLAGGSLVLAGIPLGEARRLRAAVLDSIAAQDFSRIN
ncbi:PH domain-containing protein [Pelagerythrobacter sp.]|uniref:PH domain-containing protein n=1 Tax=Pelagerythrobacter sp. TaxID=2800702 RepID=UPI0035B28F5B